MKITIKNRKGLKLSVNFVEPNSKNKEILIVIHGYGSFKNKPSQIKFQEELEKNNISFIFPDQTGCGESEGVFGKTTMSDRIEDIETILNFVKDKGYEKINLFGTSIGGLFAMELAIRHKDINKIFLKAPVSDYYSQRELRYGKEYIKKWKEQGFIEYVDPLIGKNDIDYNFLIDAKKYVMFDKVKNINCPVFIIYGTEDKSVPIEHTRRLVKNIKNAELVELEGADHDCAINGDSSKQTKLIIDYFKNGTN